MKSIKQILILAGATLVFLCAVYLIHNMAPVVENVFYDLSFSFVQTQPPDSVVIVGIDAKSVGEIGAWPWSRVTFSKVIAQIEACNPRVIALDFLFPKRIDDPGSDSLARVFSNVGSLVVGLRLDAVSDEPSSMALVTTEAYKHRFLLLDNQEKLAGLFAYSAGKVDFGDSYLTMYADRAGFLNVSTRRTSQKLRELVHVIRAGNEYYPSFGVAAVAQFLGLRPDQLVLDGNGMIRLGSRELHISEGTGSVPVNWLGKSGTVTTYSACDVLAGRIKPHLLRNKLVFVGIVDAPSSSSDFFITPVGTQFPGVEIWATAADNILRNATIKSNALITTINIIFVLLLFPGFVILFSGTRKKFGIIIGAAMVICSVFAGLFLLQSTGYIWNSGFHIYAWIMLIVWFATQKSDIIIIEQKALHLEPTQAEEADSLAPPSEQDFLKIIPSTDTAAFVIRKIAPQGFTYDIPLSTVDKTLIESDTNPAQSRLMDQSAAVAEFQKLAGGRIVRCLGSGGMADVYLIWHPRMEIYRAVKVIKPGQPSQWLERFETEIRIFANLNHHNIVQCYGVGEWFSLPYLDMEYVRGASMEEIVKKCTSLSAEETCAIGMLVCRALQYAHFQNVTVYGKTYKGIVHRDLKPANILLSRSGHIKLTDFGIARPGAVSLHTADTGKVIGTLPYLAPEQLNEEALTARTDIYALGATLYELLTGQRAFPQNEVPALVTAKTSGGYKPLKSSSQVPKELVEIIDRAMALDVAARFDSAVEMESALEKVLSKLLTDKSKVILGSLVQRAFNG